jgi:Tol biopolymer transport system component
MNIDGTELHQVTNELGYDGGAFFTMDCKQLIFRASRPKTDSAVKEYKELLSQYLVAPTEMELYIVNVDGTNLRQITTLGKANWAPYMHPNGSTLLFSSNHASQKGYDFQLYMMQPSNAVPEAVTTESVFNAFPMFSINGRRLVWSSNRNNGGTHDTNVFIADYEQNP